MKRRDVLTLLSGVAVWPFSAHAQSGGASGGQATQRDTSIGQVATVSGNATVTRGGAAAVALRIAESLFKNDVLETGPDSSLGVTFDDQSTFSLSANSRIAIDEFVYEDGGNANAGAYKVALGTAAFVAGLIAKTGDMKISTDYATIGVRGTTGVVEVPENGAATPPTVKLYPDADGHVGQIEVFDRQGGRLGILTRGASAFAFRPGPGGRIAALPYQIPPQEAARDRGVLQRLNASHTIGRQLLQRRQQLRLPNRGRPNNQNQPQQRGQPNQQPGRPIRRPPQQPHARNRNRQ